MIATNTAMTAFQMRRPKISTFKKTRPYPILKLCVAKRMFSQTIMIRDITDLWFIVPTPTKDAK